MRKLRNYFLTVATLLCCTAATWAQTTFENAERTLKFTVIDEENHYVSVKGRDYYLAGALEIPETVKYPDTDEGVTYTVTSIDEYAFNGYTRLTSVTIPKTVTNISTNAFRDCIGLTSITIPESVTEIGKLVFYYYCNSCSFITEITFEGETPPTTLEKSAFVGRDCLFFVPSAAAEEAYRSVLPIETNEVVACSAVAEIDGIRYALNGTDKDATVLANNYSGNVVIPESIQYSDENYSVTAIGKKAFKDCLNLSSITIPESVTSIGYYAFENCTDLTEVTIPNSATNISEGAFSGCSGLTSVTISNSVTEIGAMAFNGCSNITSITIPELVTNIGAAAFYNCRGLTTVTIPNSVTSIGEGAFSGCSSLTKITLPFVGDKAEHAPEEELYPFGYIFGKTNYTDGVATQQPYYCRSDMSNGFYSATFYIPASLKDVVITGSSITARAFYNCTGLTSVTISNSVTEIGAMAFNGCSNITSITIPELVTNIGASAFYNCSNITHFTFKGETPPTIDKWTSFENTNNCPMLVPSIAVDAYKSAMSSFASRITAGSIAEIEGIKYVLNETIKEATVLASNNSGDVDIPANVTYSGEDYSVTAIFRGAFNGCTGLTSLTIPEGVTSIGISAFQNCTNLETVNFNATNCTTMGPTEDYNHRFSVVFKDCPSLTTLNIGDNVETIPVYAFSGCSNLTTITIPEGIKSIAYYAFENCTGLETVNFNATNCTSMKDAFSGCSSLATLNIGDNVETIPEYAFYKWTGIASITIPESVTTIGDYAFRGCTSLETVNFNAANCTSMGRLVTPTYEYINPFADCSSFTTLNIGENVENIPAYAFYGRSSLTTVNIPASVTSISDKAFENCNGLTSITTNCDAIGDAKLYFTVDDIRYKVLDKNSVSIVNYKSYTGDLVISGTVTAGNTFTVTNISERLFENYTGLTSVVVPNTVTSIGKCAFYGCSNLTKISLPFVGDKPCTAEDTKQNVFGYIFGYTTMNWIQLDPFTGSTRIQSKYIGDEVNGYYFYIPSGLREVVITGCSYIPPYAFNNCSMLTSITIPESVTSVGKKAFCYTNSDIIFEGATPPSFGGYVFENSSSYSTYPIYVPTEEAVVEYKAAENMQSDYSDYRNRVMVNPYSKVTVVANNDDYGTVSGSGTYNRTTTPTVTITATAAEHCSFICWAEDGATEATREITLSGAATYTAIFKRTVTISNVVAENKEYNGNAEAAISYDAEGLLDGDDVTVTPTAAFADANAGQGKVVSYSFELSGNDADNYVFANGSQSGITTADITPILVSEPEIVLSATEFTYSGEAQTPTVTVKNGETVIAAAEYEVSFSDDVTNVGEKTVTVSNIAGNYTVNGSATYTINPAAEAPNKPEATMETRYINTEFIELPENWQWAENVALELGDNTATAEYAGADAGNYLIESVDVTINRLACEHTEGVDIINALEPTCTAEGYTGDQRCKICGEIIATGEAITAAGHKADSVAIENVVAATSTSVATYDSVIYCSVCKAEISCKKVYVTASSMAVSKQPSKVEYKQGEKLDVKGGKVTVSYSDNSTADFEMLAGWVSGFDSQKVGKQQLTVTFDAVSSTLTATFSVTVKEADNTAIDEDAVNAVNIYAYQNVIVVEADDAITGEIAVFDVNGRMVRKTLAAGTRTEIEMPRQGLYIVRVGTEAKRVMVY